jgi:hypothetical protein
MEVPEANKSSAADEPENREKAIWIQVREQQLLVLEPYLEPYISCEPVFKSRL